MKKITFLLTFSLLTLLSAQLSAQCPLATASTIVFDASTLVVGTPVQATNTVWGGEYITLNNMVAGATYTVDSNGSAGDTFLTIYNPSNSSAGFDDNSGTGDDASVTFVAVAGTYKAQLHLTGCGADAANHIINILLVSIPVPTDTTPPVFESSTPSASSITGATLTLNTDIDEGGTIYYVIVANGASAPTSAEVKAGTASGGGAALNSANATVNSGGFTNAFSVTGLTSQTPYDVYVVAEDDEGAPNLQTTPTKVDVTTANTTFTWTGTSDSNWATSTNWNPATVPSTDANITIPSGLTNYPTATSAVTFNSLTINSGASFIAQSTATGSVTYKRALTNKWHLVSSPLSGETIEDLRTLNTFVAGSGGDRIGLAPYNNNGPIWSYQTNTSTGSITSGQGYSTKLAAAGDISFTGSVNTGVSPINYGITQGTTNDFNLVGNPYTSYVNLGTFFTDNNAALSEQTVWMWNQATTSYDLKLSGTHASFQVAPGQGFFVHAASNTNVTFSNTNQSHQTDTFQRSSRAEINLTASENGNLKATQIYFINGTTKGFDNGFDGTVFGGVSSNFSLYSQLVNDNQGKNYAIQSLPLNDMDDIVIPIGLKLNAGKEVKFSASSTNLPNDKRIYLEDRINEKFIDITEKDYTVTLTENTNGIGQFYLRATSQKLDAPIASSIDDVSLYKSATNTLSIVGLQTENASLKVYSITGKIVSEQKFSSNGYSTVKIPSLATGVYIIELSSELGKVNKKIILE